MTTPPADPTTPTAAIPVPVTEGVVGRLREGWLRLYKDRHYWDGSPEHLAQIETDMGLLSGDMTAPLPPPVEPGPGLDEFAAWFDQQHQLAVADLNDMVADDFGIVLMAETVAQFRASRATTEGSGDGDD